MMNRRNYTTAEIEESGTVSLTTITCVRQVVSAHAHLN